MAQVAARPLDALDEAEVRRLAGEGTFARADLLQQAGHVLLPGLQGYTLRAEVRGHWRRIDRVAVSLGAGRLATECTCGSSGGICRHVAALLLHLIRDRASFVQIREDPAEAAEGPAAPPASPEETPQAELARWLERDTLAHLREIARLRGLQARGRGKTELVAGLAAALAGPASIDAALVTLNEEGRRALDAVHLLDAMGRPAEEEIGVAHRALGGPAEPGLGALLDLGLVVAAEPGSTYTFARYRVPRVVGMRLPVLPNLAHPADRGLLVSARPVRPATHGPRLGIEVLLQVVGRQIAKDGVPRWRPTPQEMDLRGYVPPSWRIDPAELQETATARDLLDRRKVRLLPGAPLLEDADLERIDSRVGQGIAHLAFAVQLLADLGILGGAHRLVVDEARLRALLEMAPAARLAALARTWLAMTNWTELDLAVGREGSLQILFYLVGSGGSSLLVSRAAAARRLVARAVGRMVPGVWHDLESFLGLLTRLAPELMGPEKSPYGRDRFSIARRPRPDGSSPEGGPTDPTLLRDAFLTALLMGPLAWLGLVDVVSARDRLALRVRPEAAVLVGREVPERPVEEPASITVYPDLTVLVPAGASDMGIHALLARIGELEGATPEGLRYHLTADRVHASLDNGATGPELIQALADRSRGGLPEAARSTLERWWAGYGTVRLYDDLCLIELADDYLLPELLAATPLRAFLVHTFSPRLIAVAPTAVDRLVAEMARLGHAPRVEEGS